MQLPKFFPDYLLSTARLIEKAFPDGVEEKYYYPLLSILGKELNHRNLGTIAEFCHPSVKSGDPHKESVFGYHEGLKALEGELDHPAQILEIVQKKLDAAGYKEWLHETESW